MPIGKNSIKRVANNGYSNVKTQAPDMENSTVIANPSPEVVEKMIPSAKKLAPKKPAAKKAPAKKSSTSAAKKPAAKKAELIVTSAVNESSEKSYVNLGSELPAYLL